MEEVHITRESIFKERYNSLGVNLTEDQYNTLVGVWNWYFEGDAKTAALHGFAGTGKSYLTKVIFHMIERDTNIALSAPTHEAKRILEEFTGGLGFTIHSLLGIRKNTKLEEFNIDNVIFDQQVEAKIKYYRFLILDEASMLNKDLRDLLLKEALKNRTKILFVGDTTQLPPVNERYSLALTEAELTFKLTKPIRQKHTNPLYILLMALVKDIHGDENSKQVLADVLTGFGIRSETVLNKVLAAESSFEYIIDLVPKKYDEEGNGYCITDGATANTMMLELFDNDPEGNNRYLAYTNKNVSSIARYVRNHVAGNPEFLEVGDEMKGYSSVIDGENEFILKNGEEYTVEDIEEKSKEHFITKDGRGVQVDIKYLDVLLRSHHTKAQTNICIAKPPYDDFQKVHNFFLRNALNRRQWSQYYSFKENMLLLENLKGKVRAERGLKLPTRDIDFNCSITVHKSQGGTFDNCIVNLKDIEVAYVMGLKDLQKKENVTDLTLAWLKRYKYQLYYVAFSRARKTVTAIR